MPRSAISFLLAARTFTIESTFNLHFQYYIVESRQISYTRDHRELPPCHVCPTRARCQSRLISSPVAPPPPSPNINFPFFHHSIHPAFCPCSPNGSLSILCISAIVLHPVHPLSAFHSCADGGLRRSRRLPNRTPPDPVTYGQTKAFHQPSGPS